MPKVIPLSKGKVALVDDEDFDRVNQWKWYASDSGKTVASYYAVRNATIKRSKVSMHRVIINAPKGVLVDHINGNGLDNRRCNLRVCTHSENVRNRRKHMIGTSCYKGVYWQKGDKKWVATIKLGGRTVHIAHCDDEEDAATFYDVAAQLFYGEFACLNFPKSPL